MQKRIAGLVVLLFLLNFISLSLQTKGTESRSLIDQPFRTVKFISDSVFFTTKNGRSFGYLNTSSRGQVEVIYVLEDKERIVDEFTMGDYLIIGNINKSLVHYEPVNRTFQYDDRFVNENFTELRGFKQVNDKAYIITENSIRYYHKQADGKWVYTKQLISHATLNPGIKEDYYDLYYFPTKSNPERVFALTTAEFDAAADSDAKLLSCFKWFNGQSQQVDGACNFQENMDIKDFRLTGKWAYMRWANQTYVYDLSLTMKTKWEQMPTQFVAGHAVTSDHLTYLFKTNQLAYYRLVQNFANDDIKMTTTQNSFSLLKKNKRMVKLNKAENVEPIGSWVLELDDNTFKFLVQFDNGDLHCYQITRSQASTEINYLFRLSPERETVQAEGQSSSSQNEESAERAASSETDKQTSGGEGKEQISSKQSAQSVEQQILALAPSSSESIQQQKEPSQSEL